MSSKIRFTALIGLVATLAFASQAQAMTITDPGASNAGSYLAHGNDLGLAGGSNQSVPGTLGLLGLGLLGIMLVFRPVPARRLIRRKDR